MSPLAIIFSNLPVLSNKAEYAHIAQVKYYLWVLKNHGIENPTGIIEYPKMRHTEEVNLSKQDLIDIPIWEKDIEKIVLNNQSDLILTGAQLLEPTGLVKGDIDGLVAQLAAIEKDAINEANLRTKADVDLEAKIDADISTEKAAGDAADVALGAKIDADVSTEKAAREAADSTEKAEREAAVATEKARIDAILSASTADADQFVEIVALINSVDTENDDAFGAFVVRTDASVDSLEVALAAEIASTDAEQIAQNRSIDSLEAVDNNLAIAIEQEKEDRANEDAKLKAQIDANDADNLLLTASVNSLEVVDGELAGDITSIDTRVLGVEGDLAAEITRAGSVESALSAELAAEIATTNGEVNVINASIDSLEVAVEEGGTYLRQTAVFTATNLFTLPQPVAFGTNDDLTVYVNGVFVDFRCSGGTDIDFTGLLSYDVDAKDKVQVMGIKL